MLPLGMGVITFLEGPGGKSDLVDVSSYLCVYLLSIDLLKTVHVELKTIVLYRLYGDFLISTKYTKCALNV